jgi:putative ABC transport system permease protein
MSVKSTALIARRSIRARIGRLISIAIAILIGVAFVVGAFVLADSLRKTFDDLFTQISENIDLQVRSALAFEGSAASGTDQRDPVPAALVDQIAAVDGVAAVEPNLLRYAQLVDQDGEAVTTQGAPTYGGNWDGDASLSGIRIKGEGVPPSGPDQVAIDKASADREDFAVGDRISVLTDTGTHEFTITALIGLGDSDGFAGATIALWDTPTAVEVLGAGDGFDAIDVAVEDGVDVATAQDRIQEMLPPQTEVVTRDVLIEENKEDVDTFITAFGNGLLGFAFVTAFVSAFLINNVFAISIGQRLRELALLRAVGANGRQVRRMIYVEALVTSVVATIVGIVAGVFVARGIVSIFNAAGAGFPDVTTVLKPRTVIMAFLVGVGITMASVIIPAVRAARIPPVAALRPELGFEALSAKRLVVGAAVTIIGAVAFVVGLFGRPGGTFGLLALAGIGALLMFLGVASVSSTVARPATKLLGWPIAKVFKAPGVLARENAGRSPRRTSATAAALMIGVALVSAASVFAASVRHTFTEVLQRGLLADYVVSDESFQGLPPAVAETLEQLPELSAVTPIRLVQVQIEGDRKDVGAADPGALAQLLNLDMQAGGDISDLTDGGVLVHKDPAADLDLEVGDTVSATFQNGTEEDLRVDGIYDDSALAGSWLISLNTLEEATSEPPRDFFVFAKLADGVTPEQGDAAVDAAMEQFPQAKVQSNAEFRDDQEGQIDQLLVVITVLLGFAIVIAVLGISITLALGVFERTREIGLLRAVGMNRRQTRRSVRWEAIIVALFGALVGIVLGTLIGIALSFAVPDTVVNQIVISWRTILYILIGAVIAGFLAAVYPSRKAAKMNVLDAIATE